MIQISTLPPSANLSSPLTNNVAGGLKGEFDDVLIKIGGGQMEDREDVLPSRPDVRSLRVDHLRHATHHHVSGGHGKDKTEWMYEWMNEKEMKICPSKSFRVCVHLQAIIPILPNGGGLVLLHDDFKRSQKVFLESVGVKERRENVNNCPKGCAKDKRMR